MLAVKWARKRQRGSNQGEVQQGPDASEPFGVNESRSTLSDSSENGLLDHENEYEMTSDHHSTRKTGIDGHCSECEICDNGGELLCCDTCRRTYHLTCLHPPPKHTPNGKWICPACCLKCSQCSSHDKKEQKASVSGKALLSLKSGSNKKRVRGADKETTAAGHAHKEKFSKLRARQKERLAHRAAVGASGLEVPPVLGCSSPNHNQKPDKAHWPRINRSDTIEQLKKRYHQGRNPAQLETSPGHTNLTRFTVPAIDSNEPAEELLKLPVSTNRNVASSDEHIHHHDRLKFPILSVDRMPQVHSSCSGQQKKIVEATLSKAGTGPNTTTLQRRPMKDVWSDSELDSLWIGVRRHGRGNWEGMLQDPRLRFSDCKTAEDLNFRWEKEKLKVQNVPAHPLQQNPFLEGFVKYSIPPSVSGGVSNSEVKDVAESSSPKSNLPHWLRDAVAEGSRKT